MREHEYPFWSAHVPIFESVLHIRNGETSDVLPLMCQGLQDYRASGAVIWGAYYTILIAEAMERAGQVSAALTLLEPEFAAVEKTGELWCVAELSRRHGQLLLKRSDP